MNRVYASMVTITVAALASCSETNYYIDSAPPGVTSVSAGGEGGALAAPNIDASASTLSGGAGGRGGSEGGGGTGGREPTLAVSSSTSVQSSASAAATVATSASSGPELVDCSGGGDDFAMPCEGGVCSRDSVCRPLARCKVSAHGWERVIDCLDPNLRAMAVYINGPARLEQGCMKEPDGSRYKPMSCPPGDKCVINLFDWTVLPSSESNGYCE